MFFFFFDFSTVKEVETLKEEVKRMKEIRAQLDSPEMSKIVFKKLFEEDINRLLMMDDMWEHRKAPTPLNYDELASQKPEEKVQQNQQAPTTAGLKDQQTLSLKDSFDSFCSRCDPRLSIFHSLEASRPSI
jgi:ubiquitin-like 1-activating enzyme E1 B